MMMTKALQFVEDPDKKTTTYKVDALAIVKENHRVCDNRGIWWTN